MPHDFDVVCLSHLRWDFVYQRPQHLLSRCARDRRVFFVEEPLPSDGRARLDVRRAPDGVMVVQPRLPEGLSVEATELAQETLLDELLAEHDIDDHVLWYYTPMARAFTRHLTPRAVVYDCMDELSLFKGAPPALHQRERELFECADIVFTGGHSLYESKRDKHPNVHAFPSSVDVAHFAGARMIRTDPADQAPIARPRMGYFGVIDERMDLDLIDAVAAARPDWQIVMVGPVVKIDPATLPRRANIHYLGGKSYQELPSYIAGWDVALMPFARNDSTRYISPTKTPEYLAAGKPVVSTSIRDVVRPYGEMGIVKIADTPAAFVAACLEAMAEDGPARRARADALVGTMSWDRTWARMSALIDEAVAARTAAARTRATTTLAPAVPLALPDLTMRVGNV
jgi:glycosyltransferase involved in cell wall biosynthesis